MADVSFNEEPSYARTYAPASTKSGLTALVMKMGLAKDDKQAQGVLIGIIVVCILVAIGVFVLSRRDVPAPPTPASESWPKPLAPSYQR